MADRSQRAGNPPATQTTLGPKTSLRREMDRLFDDFLLPRESRVIGSRALQPSIEMDETDRAYKVTAELQGTPGLRRVADDSSIMQGESAICPGPPL
jgi:HSP20 family molecular chaperone IbpA